MIATPPVPPSSQRSFVFVIAIASALVGAGVASSLGTTGKAPVPAAPVPPPVVVPAPMAVPEPTPPPSPSPLTGIPACDLVVDAMEQFGRCDKLPAATREAIQGAIGQMRDGLRQALEQMTPETHEAMVDSCTQAISAMRQAWESSGCPMHD